MINKEIIKTGGDGWASIAEVPWEYRPTDGNQLPS